MRLDYIAEYQVDFFLKGGKRASHRLVHEHQTIEVREVAAEVAPVVATWNDPHHAERRFDVRLFEGQFYEPAGQMRSLCDPTKPAVERFLALIPSRGEPSTMPSPDKIAQSLGDNRDRMIAFYRDKAEGFLMVDGQPYSRCGQPRLVIDLARDPQRVSITTDDVGSIRSLGGIHEKTLASLNKDGPLRERYRPDGGARVIYLYQDLAVLMPDAVEFDRKAEECARTIAQALEENKLTLYHLPREVAEEYLAIRADLDRWHADPGSVNLIELFERTFDIATSRGFYNTQLIGAYLENCGKVRRNLPEETIAVKMPLHVAEDLRV